MKTYNFSAVGWVAFLLPWYEYWFVACGAATCSVIRNTWYEVLCIVLRSTWHNSSYTFALLLDAFLTWTRTAWSWRGCLRAEPAPRTWAEMKEMNRQARERVEASRANRLRCTYAPSTILLLLCTWHAQHDRSQLARSGRSACCAVVCVGCVVGSGDSTRPWPRAACSLERRERCLLLVAGCRASSPQREAGCTIHQQRTPAVFLLVLVRVVSYDDMMGYDMHEYLYISQHKHKNSRAERAVQVPKNERCGCVCAFEKNRSGRFAAKQNNKTTTHQNTRSIASKRCSTAH